VGKIIAITFAFLGFVFYQMSGGADFVPIADEKRAALKVEDDARRLAEAEVAATQAAKVAQAQAQAQVKPGVFEAPTVQAAQPVSEPVAQPAAEIVLASAEVPAAMVVETPLTQDEADARLAAAISEALASSEAEVVAEVEANVPTLSNLASLATDIREVTAARVNMRNGPGQSFDVVGKLGNGERVEILQDPGDGWVKLRVVEGGRVGWMADFLLTASID
jgi:hypothetical protein